VSDAVFQRARALLGEKGVVDLTGLVGYYTLLALTLNAFEVPVPEDGEVPWRT
jgi:4-carboxymuconolactone decarboxylase